MKYFFIGLVFTLSSCVSSQIKFADTRGKIRYDKWEHFYLFGSIPTVKKTEKDLCRAHEKISMVKVGMKLHHYAAAFLTAGIYVPANLQVWCKK